MGLGLVLLPTLALAVLARGVVEADRQARARERLAQQQRLQVRTSELADTLSRHADLFPHEPSERFALGLEHPELAAAIEVDGSCHSWRLAEDASARPCETSLLRFERAELLERDSGVHDQRDFSFAFVAARQKAFLHLFFRVTDDQLAPRGRQLDERDHLKLVSAVPESGGASIPRRFIVALGPNGDIISYQVDRTWQREVPAQRRSTWGQYRVEPHRRPYGKWRKTVSGYDIELRLPLRTLGPAWREAEIGIAVADFDVRPELEPGFSRQTMWIVPQQVGELALLAPDAGRFRAALKDLGLDLGTRRLAIFDARGRELMANLLDPEAPDGELRDRAKALLAASRLADAPVAPVANYTLATARVEAHGGGLIASVLEADPSAPPAPAFAAVLLELPATAAAIAAALLLLFLLLGYTRRLSTRLLALVDDVGADREADDEIGELSRRLSDFAERDRAQRGYLEQLPRILSHETLGPLGVVKMAIDELPEGGAHRESARRAIRSVEDLVEDLREATSLEEALTKGERVHVDLVEFLQEYASAYREAKDMPLELSLPDHSFRIQVIERRLDQLLDKLLDNARDFSRGAPVSLALEWREDAACIRVENQGSQLPPGISAEQLFSPMSSWRKRTAERHLGLGLYLARVIAEHHGGGIAAWNEGDDCVIFEVTLRRDPA
jgi:signal transduction histidine kinase